jgi:hypothetical protein
MPLYGADGSTFIGGEQGPQGPAGPQGPVGDDGITITDVSLNGAGELIVSFSDSTTANFGAVSGIKGDQGIQGASGSDGLDGDIGTQGPQGPQGVAGSGSVGPTGAVGPQGPQGIKGSKGNVGSIGPAGPQGIQGTQGPIGTKGDKGNIGSTGPQGGAGPIGADGDSIASVTINAENELIVVSSDGTVFNAGVIASGGGGGASRVGEIIYFAGTPDARYVLCDGSQYSEVMFPELAASGLTPVWSIPGGLESLSFQAINTTFFSTDQGDSKIQISEYAPGKFMVSGIGTDNRVSLIDTTNGIVKSKMRIRANGAFQDFAQLVHCIPELAFNGLVPVIAKLSSTMAYFDIPETLTATGNDIVVDVQNFRSVSANDVTNPPVGGISNSYASTSLFSAFVDGDIAVIATSGSTAILLTSSDFGATFQFQQDITVVGNIPTNIFGTVDGTVMIQRDTRFDYFASYPDLISNTFVSVAVPSGFNLGSRKMAYNSQLGIWALVHEDGTSQNYDSGTLSFYDPVDNSLSSFTKVDISGQSENICITSAGNGFLVCDTFTDNIDFYQGAIAPVTFANTVEDSAFPGSRGAYIYFSEATDTVLLGSGPSSRYVATYTTIIGSTDTFFLPFVPSSGDAMPYIRATDE